MTYKCFISLQKSCIDSDLAREYRCLTCLREITIKMDRGEVSQGNLYVEVSPSPLDLAKYAQLVADDGAGATATFTGTTRNTFNGKVVERLEYEAYVPMALKQLQEMCEAALKQWSLIKIAVAHRTGVVGVGEASVVIATSSAHRRDALEVRKLETLRHVSCFLQINLNGTMNDTLNK